MTDTPTKPKPPGKLIAETRMPETQGARAMVAEAQSVVAGAKDAARTAQSRAAKAARDVKASEAKLAKSVGKLGAEKLTPEEQRPKPPGKKSGALSPAEQRRRFEELSRELGTDNGETLDRVFGKIVPPKLKTND